MSEQNQETSTEDLNIMDAVNDLHQQFQSIHNIPDENQKKTFIKLGKSKSKSDSELKKEDVDKKKKSFSKDI